MSAFSSAVFQQNEDDQNKIWNEWKETNKTMLLDVVTVLFTSGAPQLVYNTPWLTLNSQMNENKMLLPIQVR